MTHDRETNPCESPEEQTAVHGNSHGGKRIRGQDVLETLIITGAIAGVAMLTMSAARGGPRADIPTLHSTSSYIITFRQAATGPGAFFGWLIALVVICLPGVLLQSLASLVGYSLRCLGGIFPQKSGQYERAYSGCQLHMRLRGSFIW